MRSIINNGIEAIDHSKSNPLKIDAQARITAADIKRERKKKKQLKMKEHHDRQAIIRKEREKVLRYHSESEIEMIVEDGEDEIVPELQIEEVQDEFVDEDFEKKSVNEEVDEIYHTDISSDSQDSNDSNSEDDFSMSMSP